MTTKSEDVLQVKVLVDAFDPRELASGVYGAVSFSPAFNLLLASAIAGYGKIVGQRYVEDGGMVVLVDIRGSMRRNASEVVADTASIQVDKDSYYGATADYRDWQRCWWREVIQNAVDAGAAHVRLNSAVDLEDPSMWIHECEDDGSGMDQDILLTRFLRAGGSGKRARDEDRNRPQIDCDRETLTEQETAKTVGGFGVAKLLILFAWPRWEIRTRDLYVKGSGAERTVYRETSFVHGTIIRVWMPADEKLRAGIENAESVIARSTLPGVTFYVNGQRRLARASAGGEIQGKSGAPGRMGYCATAFHNPTSSRRGIHVRTGGMWMYDITNVTDVAGEVFIEIDKARSRSLLSSHRTSVRHDEVNDWLNRILTALATDPDTTTRKAAPQNKRMFPGADAPREHVVASVLAAMPPLPPLKKGRSAKLSDAEAARVAQLAAQGAGGDLQVRGRFTPEEAEALIRRMLDNVNWQHAETMARVAKLAAWSPKFFWYYEKRAEIGEPPERFHPDHMKGRELLLARVWTALCRVILMNAGCDRVFNVGWVFDDSMGACYYQEAGSEYLLLCPTVRWTSDTDAEPTAAKGELLRPESLRDAAYIWALAKHECAHMLMPRTSQEFGDHGQRWGSWVSKLDQLFAFRENAIKKLIRDTIALHRAASKRPPQQPEPAYVPREVPDDPDPSTGQNPLEVVTMYGIMIDLSEMIWSNTARWENATTDTKSTWQFGVWEFWSAAAGMTVQSAASRKPSFGETEAFVRHLALTGIFMLPDGTQVIRHRAGDRAEGESLDIQVSHPGMFYWYQILGRHAPVKTRVALREGVSESYIRNLIDKLTQFRSAALRDRRGPIGTYQQDVSFEYLRELFNLMTPLPWADQSKPTPDLWMIGTQSSFPGRLGVEFLSDDALRLVSDDLEARFWWTRMVEYADKHDVGYELHGWINVQQWEATQGSRNDFWAPLVQLLEGPVVDANWDHMSFEEHEDVRQLVTSIWNSWLSRRGDWTGALPRVQPEEAMYTLYHARLNRLLILPDGSVLSLPQARAADVELWYAPGSENAAAWVEHGGPWDRVRVKPVAEGVNWTVKAGEFSNHMSRIDSELQAVFAGQRSHYDFQDNVGPLLRWLVSDLTLLTWGKAHTRTFGENSYFLFDVPGSALYYDPKQGRWGLATDDMHARMTWEASRPLVHFANLLPVRGFQEWAQSWRY